MIKADIAAGGVQADIAADAVSGQTFANFFCVFRRGKDGELLFFPFSDSGRGVVVPDEKTAARFLRAKRRWNWAMVASTLLWPLLGFLILFILLAERRSAVGALAAIMPLPAWVLILALALAVVVFALFFAGYALWWRRTLRGFAPYGAAIGWQEGIAFKRGASGEILFYLRRKKGYIVDEETADKLWHLWRRYQIGTRFSVVICGCASSIWIFNFKDWKPSEADYFIVMALIAVVYVLVSAFAYWRLRRLAQGAPAPSVENTKDDKREAMKIRARAMSFFIIWSALIFFVWGTLFGVSLLYTATESINRLIGVALALGCGFGLALYIRILRIKQRLRREDNAALGDDKQDRSFRA